MIRSENSSAKSETLKILKEIIPAAFVEGKLNPFKLQDMFDEEINDEREYYGLRWLGRRESLISTKSASEATLRPIEAKSCKFKEAENLLIEGENLEVLKVLQKSYYGKIKMIYIDPPYNTGNDFIYPDNYKEPLESYLIYSGQLDEEGNVITSDVERSGRKHSNWLSLMYPRLVLARNLLTNDGIIVVSIDDHEIHNLTQIMNEIYGEENRLGTFIWKRRQNVDSRSRTNISEDHEYILCYGKTEDAKLTNIHFFTPFLHL
jgi:adenine-specific DNA-methyltransferase